MEVNITNADFGTAKRLLRMCPVCVCRTKCLALLDTSAVPNMISVRHLAHLGIELILTRRTITVANSVYTTSKKLILHYPVLFAKPISKLDFLAVRAAPLDVYIGLTDLERLQITFAFGRPVCVSCH